MLGIRSSRKWGAEDGLDAANESLTEPETGAEMTDNSLYQPPADYAEAPVGERWTIQTEDSESLASSQI